MLSARKSGVLAHVTSLPNAEGMGALGPEAFAFIDRLAEAGQAVWQILPLNPTQIDGSPYAALSSFAGAEHVLSLTQLAREGWLTPAELAPLAALDRRRIDFAQALPLRRSLAARAAARFLRGASAQDAAACAAFRAKAGPAWLDDYALFRAALERHAWADWSDWPEALRLRQPEALAAARADLAARIEEICVEQFFFDRQWRAVRAHAAARGVAIFGDMPIYVAQTSADVWAASRYFHLDAHGKPITVAGCPPDMMAAGGQRWGNPTYRWEVMQADGFAWWKQRLAHMLDWYDLVRIDHFRAFASYWDIRAADENAINGRWIPAPGHALFREIAAAFGAPAVVAEDLGFITPDVYELRDAFGFPGMRIIQYELEEEPLAPEARPEAFPANSVAYFGNHDNETALGWLYRWRDQLSPEQIAARPILAAALQSPEPHWALIELTLASGSNLAVLQLQDILGLGAETRMNVPGTASGNWGWRFEEAETPPALRADLARRTTAAGRAPKPSPAAQDARLEALLAEVDAEFLTRQHPATGLLPAGPAHNSHGDYSHAWVRDNCYCVLAIWAASAAARRAGRAARAQRYTEAAERLMRGLLAAMQGQEHKVERFLRSRSPADALHAKYDAATGAPVSGDADWGHLQIDATALYLLLCADMTAGGLSIIRTQSEAGFLARLADYVALAWRCGDYGMWERGDKRNIGRVERNSSSIGLALAALRALPRAAFRLSDQSEPFRLPASDPALLALFEETLRGALPEESFSKEIDAGLLSAVGYPGFALSDAALMEAVRVGVQERLAGRYGAARFLLDGHQSPHEHPHRLHYEPGELAAFAGLECQWPLFHAFEAADAALRGATPQLEAALARLEAVAVPGAGWPLIPELYRVEAESAAAERLYPNSQTRRPNDNVPLYWAQSLYLVARLLGAGLVAPDDLDPLRRRDGAPPTDASAAAPLHRLLARGLMLRDAQGRWRDALSEGAIEEVGFEALPPSLFAALAEEADALHARYGRAVVGLDLPALAPGGAALVRRLARAQPLNLARTDPLRRDWRLWRAEHGALAPVGGGFARAVWASLARCAGLLFPGGVRIDAALSRADHTEGERAFAHQLLLALTESRDLVLRTLTMEALRVFAEGDRRLAGDLDLANWIAQAGGLEPLAGLAPAAARALLEAAMPGVAEEAPLRASVGK